MNFLAHYFLLVTFSLVFTSSCMQPLTIEHKKNAGDFGKLPQEVVAEIAAYCEPVDRCAMRYTGKFLNQQLQSLKENDKNFLLMRKNLRREDFQQNLKSYYQSIVTGTKVIDRLCCYADIALGFTSAVLLILNSIYDEPAKVPLALKIFIISRKLGLGFSAAEKLAIFSLDTFDKIIPPILLMQSLCSLPMFIYAARTRQHLDVFGLCTAVFRKPAVYCHGLATHLWHRKNISNKARHCFSSKEQYLALPPFNQNSRELNTGMDIIYRYNLRCDNLLLNASTASICLTNLKRASSRLHSTILNALPPCRKNLAVHHDE